MTAIDSITNTHVCPKCHQEKQLTIEFWYMQKMWPNQPWRKDACRSCRNDLSREISKIRARERRAEDRIAYNQKAREWKRANFEKRQEYRRNANEKK